MFIKHISLLLLCVAGGLALSIFTFPNREDVAAFLFKDERYDEVREAYEANLASGDKSNKTVTSMVKMYMHLGEYDQAIKLLETFLQTHPQQVEARELLGGLYKKTGMQGLYLANLEKLVEIAPQEARWRELAQLYQDAGEFDKQLIAWQRLVVSYPQRTKDILQLANLLMARGKFDKVIEYLSSIETRSPAAMNDQTRKALIKAYIESGQSAQAIATIHKWFAKRAIRSELLAYGRLLLEKNQYQEVLTLFTPFQSRYSNDAEFSGFVSSSLIAMGLHEKAFEFLEQQRQAGALADTLLKNYVEAGLNAGRMVDVAQEINRHQLGNLDHFAVAGIAEKIIEKGDKELQKILVDTLDNAFYQAYPLTAARLFWTQHNNHAALEWLEKVEIKQQPFAIQLWKSTLLAEAGNKHSALSLLEKIVRSPLTPITEYRNFAYLFIEWRGTRQGLQLYEEILKTNSDQEVQQGWALLATASHQQSKVANWLQKQNNTDYELIKDIYFLAHDRKLSSLSLVAAQRMFALQPDVGNRFFLAAALLDNNRLDEAIAYTQPVSTKNLEMLYIEALTQSGKHAELASWWKNKLLLGKLSSKEEQAAVHALFGLQQYAEVLPYLKQYVAASQSEWADAYVYAVEQLGHKNELVRYLKAQIKAPGISSEERRRIAYRLLDNGDKAGAIEAFLPLAATAPVNSADVRALLFLWGPRPNEYARDWLEQRAVKARADERAAWLDIFMNMEDTARIVRVVEKTGSDRLESIRSLYAQALAKEEKWQMLTTVLRDAADQPASEAAMRRYAHLSESVKQPDLAATFWQHVLKLAPNDNQAHRWLAMNAFRSGAWLTAQLHFESLAQQQSLDAEASYFYGETLAALGSEAEAMDQYKKVLVLNRGKAHAAGEQKISALAYMRLGQIHEATTIFERLLNQFPNDLDLVGDYASVLLNNGFYDKAEKVLKQIKQ